MEVSLYNTRQYTIAGALRLKRGVALGGALLTVDAGERPPVRDSGVWKRDCTMVFSELLSSWDTSSFSVSLFFSRNPSVS